MDEKDADELADQGERALRRVPPLGNYVIVTPEELRDRPHRRRSRSRVRLASPRLWPGTRPRGFAHAQPRRTERQRGRKTEAEGDVEAVPLRRRGGPRVSAV